MFKIALATAIAFCASSAVSAEKYEGLTLPLGDSEQTVSVGEQILESIPYFISVAGITEAEGRRVDGKVVIPAGAVLYTVSTSAKFKGCTALLNEPNPAYYATKDYYGCMLDDDGDGVYDRIASDSIAGAKPLVSPVPYHKEKRKGILTDTKMVLLYQGAETNTLRISYREFMRDATSASWLAREAFTEELSIPIKSEFPQDVMVKKIHLRLMGIDGMGLRYKIVTGT